MAQLKIQVSAASQLQFGSFIQLQILTIVDGVNTNEEYFNFDANNTSVAYNAQAPNNVVFHFDGAIKSISNGDYNEYSFGGIPKASALELAEAILDDIAQYTT